MRSELLNRGYDGGVVRFLPHTVDLSRYSVLDESQIECDCLFVGAFIRRKRPDLLLRALARVRARVPSVKAVLVGDGPLMAEVRALRRELALEQTVELPGFVSDPRRLYSTSRIIMIGSRMEGFPFALVEGMVSGAVPVATDVGTVSDMIDSGRNGLVVPVDDVDRFSEALLRLLEDAQLCRDMRARVIAEREQFGYTVATALWERVLPEMAADG